MREGTPAVKRAVRLEQIEAILEAMPHYVTVYEIAYQMHLEASGYLYGLIKELEQSGKLHKVEAHHRKNVTKFYYGLESKRQSLVQGKLL